MSAIDAYDTIVCLSIVGLIAVLVGMGYEKWRSRHAKLLVRIEAVRHFDAGVVTRDEVVARIAKSLGISPAAFNASAEAESAAVRAERAWQQKVMDDRAEWVLEQVRQRIELLEGYEIALGPSEPIMVGWSMDPWSIADTDAVKRIREMWSPPAIDLTALYAPGTIQNPSDPSPQSITTTKENQ